MAGKQNIPGRIEIVSLKSIYVPVHLYVYIITGQKIFAKKLTGLETNNSIAVELPGSGTYFITLVSRESTQTFKAIGSNSIGNVKFNYSNGIGNYFKSVDITATQFSDFSFQIGDSLKISVYKSGYSATLYISEISENKHLVFDLKPQLGEVTDAECNTYKTVKIGSQVWMAENLKVTQYSDGTPIPNVTGDDSWAALGDNTTDKAYCWYNDSIEYKNVYGALYTYAAATNGTSYNGIDHVQGVCPNGWHLPSEAEWTQLENYLADNGYNYDGSTSGGNDKIAKSMASKTGWHSSADIGDVGNQPETNNSSGFLAFPGGGRKNYNGSFYFAGSSGYWWSISEGSSSYANFRSIFYNHSSVSRSLSGNSYGYSVRCLRDGELPKIVPIAQFTSDKTEIKKNEKIRFTDQSDNNPTSWFWDFGDSTGSTAQNPAHFYSTAGTYTVKLTVSNETGTDTITKTDYVTVTESNDSILYGSVTDVVGNVYITVEIGDQEWMAENLAVTKYADGTPIENKSGNSNWAALGDNNTDKAYCWYNDDITNKDVYGALYTYAAATNGTPHNGTDQVQGVCPTGWHLPSDEEWKELEMYLGMSQEDVDSIGWRGTDEGAKLKASSGWNSDGNGTDDYGFSALPGGDRPGYIGDSRSVFGSGAWWSSTEGSSDNAYIRSLFYNFTSISRVSSGGKSYGFSVRCLRDEELPKIVPTAHFTSDKTELKENEPVQFTDQSDNHPTSWFWEFGDSTTSTEQNPAHFYSTAGTYTVKLTASNETGTDTITKTDYITVTEILYGSVTDVDGNVYKTIEIGDQWWMAENLAVTQYADGTSIPNVTGDDGWAVLGDNNTDKAYCWYNDSIENKDVYGALYTYAAATNGTPHDGTDHVQGACPTGWHLPSDEEWKVLEMYLGMGQADADDMGARGDDEGNKLKASSGWNSDGNGTDIYGFSALPGGCRNGFNNTFNSAGNYGLWWNSTESAGDRAYGRILSYSYAVVLRNIYSKSYAYSVRCLRD